MSCPHDEELFYGRAFRLLENGTLKSFDSHLGQCPRCAERAESLQRRLGCLQLLPEIEPPPDLADRVLARIRATGRWRRRLYLCCMAGLLLLGLTMIHLLMLLAQNKAEHRFLRDLEHQLQIYRNEHGAYPPHDRPLADFVTVPAHRRDAAGHVLDRWGRPYRYTAPGLQNTKLFDLQSLGRNGLYDGGEGDDIANW